MIRIGPPARHDLGHLRSEGGDIGLDAMLSRVSIHNLEGSKEY